MKFIVAAMALAVLQPPHATLVLHNPTVRAYRTTAGALEGVPHGPGVVVWLEGTPAQKPGRAIWVDDAAVPPAEGAGRGPIAIIQPLARATATPAPPSGSKPGEAPFTGMSFAPQFENTRVSVLRARMDVNAREGFHTHASDTVVVHLSGGDIEDTANGKTVVNRWKPGDVEFEARGSSHSARNISHPIDVVLVALKP
jgi:quercetin dioxygenase-like cupin family protein